jgi:hypothetical protein
MDAGAVAAFRANRNVGPNGVERTVCAVQPCFGITDTRGALREMQDYILRCESRLWVAARRKEYGSFCVLQLRFNVGDMSRKPHPPGGELLAAASTFPPRLEARACP